MVPISGTITAQSKDPVAILASARQALGGEKKLSTVKSFTATGRTRQVRGDNLVPIEFEIFVELPDKYLRKDEIPAQESGPTASGFNGEEWLQDPPPAAPPAAATPPAAPPGSAAAAPGAPGSTGASGRGPDPRIPAGPAGPPRNPSAARVATLKQDFTRLTLGMFAASFPSYPLTFTYVSEAEAPQGRAEVLEAKGPNNFTIRFFINKETHLPIMVSWTPPAPAGRPGGPGPGRGPMPGAAPGGERGAGPGGERGAPPAGAPPAGAPPAAGPPAGTPPAGAPPAGAPRAGAPPAGAPPTGAPPAGAPPAGQRGAPPAGQPAPGAAGARPAPPAPVENRLYFADYRDVDGMQFPFRLRRAVGADTIEETTFDRYKINAKIDPKKFEVRKPQ
jgi:hypothetical protein